jgi:signal transduction histidine kinase
MVLEIERRAQVLARLLAGLGVAIAVTVLIGYATATPRLIHFAPRLLGMSPLTAICLCALGLGLLAAARGSERVVQAAVLVSIVCVGIVLVSHVTMSADAINPWLAERIFGIGPAVAGRMSTGTALTLMLIAAALAARKRADASDLAAGTALLVSCTVLLGFLYGAQDAGTLPIFATMGLPTALGLLLLSLAALLVEPGLGWSAVLLSSYFGGRVTRRQLGLLLLPAITGWLLHLGTAAHTFDPSAALVLLVILTFAPMALLVLRDGRTQIELDTERRSNAAAQAMLARDLETRLALKAEQLEHESSERSRIEAAMYRTQRVEAIGQLTGGIAHDFNNLLAAIGGNLELMLRKLPEDHLARRYAVTAANAVGKGAKLAGQLLAFSRSQKLAIQPIEVAPALKRTRELIGTSLGPSIDVLLEFSRERVWAKTDPDQLELALFNLAVNARDAMPEGGQLRLEADVRRVRLASDDEERPYVSIRVIDNGSGMTPEVAAKSIEPFFTTRERGKSTGLGLAQVYGFVRQCEGELLIDSQPGQGTTIEMLLPTTDAPSGEANGTTRRMSYPVGPGAGRRHVLVIDDDDSVRGVLVELLIEAGYEVSAAIDGLDGLAIIEQLEPDAAVIDFLMPGMNGVEVARRARTMFPRLPVVFVSGYSDTVALESIRDAIVLRKPFQSEQLQAAIEQAFEVER